MRWVTEPLRHRRGEEREVVRFAWFPTSMDDGTTVWLESYWTRQRVEHLTNYEGGSSWFGWATEERLPLFKCPGFDQITTEEKP